MTKVLDTIQTQHPHLKYQIKTRLVNQRAHQLIKKQRQPKTLIRTPLANKNNRNQRVT